MDKFDGKVHSFLKGFNMQSATRKSKSCDYQLSSALNYVAIDKRDFKLIHARFLENAVTDLDIWSKTKCILLIQR